MEKDKIPQDEIERLINKYKSLNNNYWDRIQRKLDILEKSFNIQAKIDESVTSAKHRLIVSVIDDLEQLLNDYKKKNAK